MTDARTSYSIYGIWHFVSYKYSFSTASFFLREINEDIVLITDGTARWLINIKSNDRHSCTCSMYSVINYGVLNVTRLMLSPWFTLDSPGEPLKTTVSCKHHRPRISGWLELGH